MTTTNAQTQIPKQLLDEVRRLKQYMPYRICWGAWNPETGETKQGACYDKRKLNKALRSGMMGFIV